VVVRFECGGIRKQGRQLSLGRHVVIGDTGMEDPASEVEGVMRALVDKPTLQRRAETLHKFFTLDVEFYHL